MTVFPYHTIDTKYQMLINNPETKHLRLGLIANDFTYGKFKQWVRNNLDHEYGLPETEKKEKRIFTVTVSRTSISSIDVEVTAEDEDTAKELALDEAEKQDTRFDFYDNYDYEIEDITDSLNKIKQGKSADEPFLPIQGSIETC